MINVYIYLEPQICIVRLILNVRDMTQSSVFKLLSMLSHNSLRPTFMELNIYILFIYTWPVCKKFEELYTVMSLITSAEMKPSPEIWK